MQQNDSGPRIIDKKLRGIQPGLDRLLAARQEYDGYRAKTLGRLRDRINAWAGRNAAPDEVRGYSDDYARIPKDGETPGGYEAYFPYVRGFFGEKASGSGLFRLGDGFVRFFIRKDVAEEIQRLCYAGVRAAEAAFYGQFVEQALGDDFRGVFPYSAGDPLSFMRDYDSSPQREPRRLGRWDYVDEDFCRRHELPPELAAQLRGCGIQNPERINPEGGFEHPKAGDVSRWAWALSGNKSTRLIGWAIGTWPLTTQGKPVPVPPEIKVGSYDLAYIESDQSSWGCGPDLVCDLVRVGRYVVANNRYAQTGYERMMKTGKLKPLLVLDESTCNLYERI